MGTVENKNEFTPSEKELRCLDFSQSIRLKRIEETFANMTPEQRLREHHRVVNMFSLDYKVSNIKTFEQLWKDSGINNWGVVREYALGFDYDDAMDCLAAWTEILYGCDKKEFDLLIEETENEIRKSNASLRGGGIIVKSANPVMRFPSYVSGKFGEYLP
jgi:hypothetical protein